jgi:hypothetical protein
VPYHVCSELEIVAVLCELFDGWYHHSSRVEEDIEVCFFPIMHISPPLANRDQARKDSPSEFLSGVLHTSNVGQIAYEELGFLACFFFEFLESSFCLGSVTSEDVYFCIVREEG